MCDNTTGKNTQLFIGKLLLILSICSYYNPAQASDAFGSMYGEEEFISIATGTKKNTREAPAIVTVIDREQIEYSSAKTLEEILERVAGIHVSYSQAGYTPIYSIRGISGDFNQQALTMINDIPITHIHNGDQGVRWSHMPSAVIEKIEIVRGPGSVLYGADAYAGVINIITRNSKAHQNLVTVQHGSFDSTSISGHGTYNLDDWEVGITFEAGTTNGFDAIVESDFQSLLDQVTGTTASEAPSPVNAGKKWLDVWAQAKKNNWIFDLGYQGRYDNEMVIGWNGSLDEKGLEQNQQFLLSGKFNKELINNSSFEQHLSLFHSEFVSDGIFLFPEGNMAFPFGLYSEVGLKEIIGRYNIAYNFKAGEQHTIRLGLDTSVGRLYDVYENKNFDSSLLPTPDNSLILITGDNPDIFLKPATRRNIGLYIQDEVLMSKQSTLTLGLRFDSYSDFGTTFNPRAAWVHQFSDSITVKALYGTAFLAPSIFQLFAINNPVRLGNPELQPDTIKTLEGSIIFQLDQDEILSLNLYQNQRSDIIELINGRYENFGKQKGLGLELEYQNDITPLWSVRGNLAVASSTDESSKRQAANVPQKQYYLESLWRINPQLTVSLESHFILDRARTSDDTRSEISDNKVFNLAAIYEFPENDINIKLGITNLTNSDNREPSTFNPPGFPGSYFPANDLPLPERQLFLEFQANI